MILGKIDCEMLIEALGLLRSQLPTSDPKREEITIRMKKIRQKMKFWGCNNVRKKV